MPQFSYRLSNTWTYQNVAQNKKFINSSNLDPKDGASLKYDSKFIGSTVIIHRPLLDSITSTKFRRSTL